MVGWVKQVIPEKISALASRLEEVSGKLTQKLSREVDTEINELNELLALQDQVCSTVEHYLYLLTLARGMLRVLKWVVWCVLSRTFGLVCLRYLSLTPLFFQQRSS